MTEEIRDNFGKKTEKIYGKGEILKTRKKCGEILDKTQNKNVKFGI